MRTSTITLVVAFALAAATTAAATAPTTVRQSVSPPPFTHYLQCPGFWVDGEFHIDRTTTTFYEQSGQPIRTVQHVRADGTLSNPLTGKSLSDSGVFKVTVDLLTGERTIDGRVSKATSPGVGVVYQSVGRLVLEPDGTVSFEAGEHDDVDNDYGDLCSYLAAP
jgi:hypothetical protein